MASIKEVAERAGCSTATVSYVLNKTRRVRPETERRVQAAVRELGYSINLTAQNLAAGRSHLLGLIISDITNPFFPEIILSFHDQALLNNMDTLVMYTNYDAQRAQVCAQRLLGARVPGVAVLTTEFSPHVRELLIGQHICSVYLDHGEAGPLTGRIAIDYATGIREAIAHLKALGHRRIGFIGGPPTLPSARRRREVFEECMAEDLTLTPVLADSDFTARGGYFTASRLLTGARPTAILAANDLLAIGAMHCAFDKGIRIPEELSVVGFDNISFTEFTQPALTTIDQPPHEIGRLAFESLWEMINDQPEGQEKTVRTSLVVRQSTGAAF